MIPILKESGKDWIKARPTPRQTVNHKVSYLGSGTCGIIWVPMVSNSPTSPALLEPLSWDISAWYPWLSSVDGLALLTNILQSSLKLRLHLYNFIQWPLWVFLSQIVWPLQLWRSLVQASLYNVCILHAWKAKWTVLLRSASSSRGHQASFWHSNSGLCVPGDWIWENISLVFRQETPLASVSVRALSW